MLSAALGVTLSAHALERVNLSTGDFISNCTHHETVDGNHIRIYLLSSDPTHPDNYQDLPASMIVGFETVPDPPPAAPPAAPAAVAASASDDLPQLLARAGAQHNIDVELLASIVKAESGGHSRAVSRAGARGLMQLMPATARDLGVEDAFRPDQNIAGGAAYLDSLLNRYDADGSRSGFDKALAAYNAGPAAVDKYHGIPPYAETKAYVARVEREYMRLKNAAARLATARLAATALAAK